MKNKLFLLLIPFILFACSKDDEDEKVYHAEYTITTGSEAILNGKSAVALGMLRLTAGNVKDYGHCWSKYANPTIESDSKSSHGECSESLEFFSDMENLTLSSNYFLRSYVIDANGVTYGNEVVVRTTDFHLGNISVWEKHTSSVRLAVAVEVSTLAPSQYGFCWAEHNNPTLNDNKKASNYYNADDNYFLIDIDGLEANKSYFFRAYGSMGFTAYSDVLEINLSEVNFKKLEITPKSDTSVSATVQYEINTNIKDHGVCWAEDRLPEITDSIHSFGQAYSNFDKTVNLESLKPNKFYKIRSYVVSENDSVYYSKPDSIQLQTSVSFGNFSYDMESDSSIKIDAQFFNNTHIKDYGVCWAVDEVPNVGDEKYSLGNSNPNNYVNFTLNNLEPDMPYKMRLYVVSRYDSVYYSSTLGVEIGFNYYCNITKLRQVSDREVKMDLDYSANGYVNDFGICWANHNTPGISDDINSFGDDLSNYPEEELMYLPAESDTYYFRAYVINKYGNVFYSSEKQVNLNFPLSLPDFTGSGKFGAVRFDIDGKQYYGLCRDGSGDFKYLNEATLSWNDRSPFPVPGLVDDYYNKYHTSTERGFVYCYTGGNIKTFRYLPSEDNWVELGSFDPSVSLISISAVSLNGVNYVLAIPHSSYSSLMRLYRVHDNNVWEYVKAVDRDGTCQASFALDNKVYITNESELFYIDLETMDVSPKFYKPGYSNSSYEENWAHYFTFQGEVYLSAENKMYKFKPNVKYWEPIDNLDGFSDESTSVIFKNHFFIGLGGIGKDFVPYILE